MSTEKTFSSACGYWFQHILLLWIGSVMRIYALRTLDNSRCFSLPNFVSVYLAMELTNTSLIAHATLVQAWRIPFADTEGRSLYVLTIPSLFTSLLLDSVPNEGELHHNNHWLVLCDRNIGMSIFMHIIPPPLIAFEPRLTTKAQCSLWSPQLWDTPPTCFFYTIFPSSLGELCSY